MSFISINTKQNPAFIDTSAFVSATPTLAAVYNAGAVAADQTALIQAGKGGPVIFKANGAATGHLFEVQDSSNNVLFDITDNNSQIIRSAQPDGATAVACIIDTTTAWVGQGTGDKLLSLRSNNVEKAFFTMYNAGNGILLAAAGGNEYMSIDGPVTGFQWVVGGSSSMFLDASSLRPALDLSLPFGDSTHRWNGVFTNSVNGGSVAANGTGLTITTNVATAAGSTGLIINNTTAFPASGGTFFDLQNAGTSVFKIFMDSFTAPRFLNTTGTGYSLSGTTGYLMGSNVYSVLWNSTVLQSYTDFSTALGTNTSRWTSTWSRQYNGVEQTVAGAATFTLDPASGESIRVTLNATVINAAGIAAGTGNPGEVMRTEFIQDGTGGRTLTQANFSTAWVFAGAAYTVTATANKRDILTWMWDTVAAKWYEIGRIVNL